MTNASFFDVWSIAHAFVAFILGLIAGFFSEKKSRFVFWFFIFLIFLWEILENLALNKIKFFSFLGVESFRNIFSDILIGIIFLFLGFFLFKSRLNRRRFKNPKK